MRAHGAWISLSINEFPSSTCQPIKFHFSFTKPNTCEHFACFFRFLADCNSITSPPLAQLFLAFKPGCQTPKQCETSFGCWHQEKSEHSFELGFSLNFAPTAVSGSLHRSVAKRHLLLWQQTVELDRKWVEELCERSTTTTNPLGSRKIPLLCSWPWFTSYGRTQD